MTNELQELDALIPEERKVRIKGEEFTIQPFKFLNVLKVLKIVFNVISETSLSDADEFTLIKVLSDNPDQMLQVFNLATNKPAKWFEDIDMDEGVDLITTIYKVNEDFFIQKLKPKLQSLNLLRSQPEGVMNQDQSLMLEENLENLQNSKSETTQENPMSQENLEVIPVG